MTMRLRRTERVRRRVVGRRVRSVWFLWLVAPPLVAYGQLHTVYEGVGAGAITAPPIGITYQENGELHNAVVLATEDRRLRLLAENGVVADEYRTGIRNPVSVAVVSHRRGGGTLIRTTAGDGGVAITSVYGGRMWGASLVPPTHPRGHARGWGEIGASVVATHVDPTGNTLIFSSPPTVSYISATGYTLWSRSLPAAVTSTASDDSAVYAGLADGRVYAFLPHGEGIHATRLAAGISDIAIGTENGKPFVVILTTEGRVVRLDGEETELSVTWSADLPQGTPGGESRFVLPFEPGRIVVFWRRGAVVVLDSDGGEEWVLDFPGAGFEDVIVLPVEGLLVGTTTDGRILSIDSTGAVTDVAALGTATTRITPLPLQGRVFLEYPDWRYEVVQGQPRSAAGPVSAFDFRFSGSILAGTSGTREDTRGALIRLAEATLSGSSRSDRSALLDALDRRIGERNLYGRVDDVIEVLSKLARESYGGPRIVGGVVQNNFPVIRSKAAGLLRYFGDRSTRQTLAMIVRYDPDVDVVVAALESAGYSGFDDAGVAEWGYQRLQAAADGERPVIAKALISFLSRTVATDREQANRFIEITANVAASDVPRGVRDAALTLSRRW